MAAHAGMRFDALMDECNTAVLDAFDHQALTYGALLGQLSLERDPSRLPLVSVAFNVDPDVASSAQAFTTLHVVQDTIARRYENFELFVNLRPLSQRDRKQLTEAGRTPPDSELILVRVEHEIAKQAVLDNEPACFSIPHLDGYAGVLVELDRATPELVEELVTESFLVCGGQPPAASPGGGSTSS